jgi:hypothetical protein
VPADHSQAFRYASTPAAVCLPAVGGRFGTQAWFSVPRLLVVWLYRQRWFKKRFSDVLNAYSVPIMVY